MNKEFYQRLHSFTEGHKAPKAAVTLATRFLPAIVYVSYPLMLVCLFLTGSPLLLRSILVPTAGFLICTVLRRWINAPRPYEALNIPSITHKDTIGQSFPSRHAACGAVIAVTALWSLPGLGWMLLAVSLLIPVSRVLAGVHFIRDVLAGWLLGAAVGFIGMSL